MFSTAQSSGETMTEQADTMTCKFPGCQNPPESATDKPGRPARVLRRQGAHRDAPHGENESGSPPSSAAPPPVTPKPSSPSPWPGSTAPSSFGRCARSPTRSTTTAGRLTSTVADLGDPERSGGRGGVRPEGGREAAATAEAEGPRPSAGPHADQARVAAEEAAEDMATQLDAAQAEAREARDQLAEATAAHAAEIEQIRADAQTRDRRGAGQRSRDSPASPGRRRRCGERR